jgi:hypothetical protein
MVFALGLAAQDMCGAIKQKKLPDYTLYKTYKNPRRCKTVF